MIFIFIIWVSGINPTQIKIRENTMKLERLTFAAMAALLVGCAACSTKSAETGSADVSDADADGGAGTGWPATVVTHHGLQAG